MKSHDRIHLHHKKTRIFYFGEPRRRKEQDEKERKNQREEDVQVTN